MGGDRTYKWVLQKADILLVDIDIGEAVLYEGVEDVTGLEQLIDALFTLAFNDGLFTFGLFPVDIARELLCDGYGENTLAGLWTYFDVVFEKGHILEVGIAVDFVRKFVDGECCLTILLIAEIVVELVVTFLFRSDDLTHKLDGRIVFARVFPALSCDDGRLESLFRALELDIDYACLR